MLKFCSQFLVDLFKVQPLVEKQIINEKVKVEQIQRQKIIIPQDTLPTECMQQIFKYVNDQGNGLYSCLFVNKYWCKNVLPLLWASPFRNSYIIGFWEPVASYWKSTLSKEALSQLNKYKFIETFISCLDNQEFSYLNSLFQNYYSINLSIGKKPLINYPSFLQELFYDDFESTIHSYLMNKFRVKYKEQQILVIATYLMKLFLSESTNLRIINFNRHTKFYKLDMPNLLLGKKSTKNSFLMLDRLEHVYISENSVDMLKQFGNIRKIKLLHCNKLTSEVLPDYSEYIAKLK
ncbi:12025_t:CDS:2 [Funneliformis geosporum]|uniref:12025_t:CDS:1 n=1 Tax=Funneliformis geosporum TaxID=1117311 RepID=A0A9W4SER9_9GLOM|nr:12025_t:CDS:2 [Funneliformis geosporum]